MEIRPLATIFSLLISISLSYSQAKGDRFAFAKESGKANLTYLFKETATPTGFNNGLANRNASGKVEGLLVDLMKEFELYVEQKHGITITSEFVGVKKGFKQFTQDIVDGEGGVFGLGSHSINEERKKILKFSPAYISNVSVLITHSSVPTLVSMDQISTQFDSKVAYTIQSTTYHRRLTALKEQHFPSMKMEFHDNIYVLLPAIAENPDAYGFVDLIFYLRYLKLGNPIKRHPAGDLRGDKYGITMPLNNDWAPVLTEFFNSGFIESPQYRQIVIDNLGKEALRMLSISSN